MKFIKILMTVFLMSSVVLIGCAPKDADIQANVEKKIQALPDASGVTVTVADGIATLSGEVKDPAVAEQVTAEVKDVKGVKSVVNNCTITPPPPPVEVNNDTALSKGVMDAIKDFPTVTATVNDGEITLTGSIKRSDLQTLMQSLNSLSPKKINNQLTIK